MRHIDQLAHFFVHLRGDHVGVAHRGTYHAAGAQRIRIVPTSRTAPIRELIPYSVTILRATSVALDIVGSARAGIEEDDLFGHTPAHRIRHLVEQLVARDRITILRGHHHGVTKGAPARQLSPW